MNLLKASLSRATTTPRDVCVVVDSTLAALLRVLDSCRLMRARASLSSANVCPSIGSAFTLSQRSTVFPQTNTSVESSRPFVQ